jgi:hypothetical protein
MTSDSYLEVNEEGQVVSYVGEDATRYFQARMVYMGLKARKVGIQLARNYTPKRLFETASRFTGKKYKLTEYDVALKDLETWLTTMELALPFVVRKKETASPSTES